MIIIVSSAKKIKDTPKKKGRQEHIERERERKEKKKKEYKKERKRPTYDLKLVADSWMILHRPLWRRVPDCIAAAGLSSLSSLSSLYVRNPANPVLCDVYRHDDELEGGGISVCFFEPPRQSRCFDPLCYTGWFQKANNTVRCRCCSPAATASTSVRCIGRLFKALHARQFGPEMCVAQPRSLPVVCQIPFG